MVDLINPHTRTVVKATGEVAERLKRAGFKPVEPPATPKRGRPKKSE